METNFVLRDTLTGFELVHDDRLPREVEDAINSDGYWDEMDRDPYCY